MAKRRIAGNAALAVLRLSAAQICLLRKFALLLHARRNQICPFIILEQEITPSLNLLVRGYLTGIQNSLQAGAINARIGNEVYTKRQTFNGFSKHLLLLLWHCELFCLNLKHLEILLGILWLIFFRVI